MRFRSTLALFGLAALGLSSCAPEPPFSTDQPWGARDFAVSDPDGFKITISSGTGEES